MSLDINYYFEHLDEFPFSDYFDGLKTPSDILAKAKPFLNDLLVKPDLHEMHGTVIGDVFFQGNYYIGENTKIYSGVSIMGPVYIGKNCEIMPGAILRPGTILSDNCNVGHGSEVKRSILFPGSKVASLAFVGDCVLGKSARIGSGVITANRKFDQTNATLKLNGEKHDLGDSFFGLILGDSSRVGANSVTQPGTHIGPHTWIYPMTNVRGFIPKEKRVFHNRETIIEDNGVYELKP